MKTIVKDFGHRCCGAVGKGFYLMEESRKSRGPLIALIALAAAAALCLCVWMLLRPGANQGAKEITVQVVHGDGSTNSAVIHTDAAYLGQALAEVTDLAVVGEDGPYGLFITSVDGEAASDADRTYWKASLDGVDLMVGVDSQPVADGEHYELTLTKW